MEALPASACASPPEYAIVYFVISLPVEGLLVIGSASKSLGREIG